MLQCDQPVDRERLSRFLASRQNGTDISGTLPMLGPPAHDTSINRTSGVTTNSSGVK
jgi:hypothetical protein